MSFFYLTPVRGDMPVHLLEAIVVQRFEYLKSTLNGNSADYSEYMVEGSLYDNVGHFMLCVVTILSKHPEFTQFFLKAEIELFQSRLASLSTYDIRCFSKKILRNLKKQEISSHLDPLFILCQHLMLKDMAQHITDAMHKPECRIHNIPLNFKHCLQFISKRQVELRNGVAYLPCGKWKQYLIMLFGANLMLRLRKPNLAQLKSDSRITDLLLKLRTEVNSFSNKTVNSKILRSKDVEKFLILFPPCMLNLHQSLRAKHRLTHNQRFYYSLFLKDIGMPVEEATEFWRGEYRQSPNGTHSCCHHWEKDEKKYLYGIRHMYGLEGGRKSYTSVSCQRIQGTEGSCSEGGCPFKSFDETKMLQLLTECNEPLWSQILELKRQRRYTSACVLFLQNKFSSRCDNVSFNFTPIRYYMLASNSMNL